MESMEADTFGKVYDRIIIWYVTKTCNFTCTQCAGNSIRLKGQYAPEIVDMRSLKKFLDNSDKTIKFSFTGGEPLLVRNIVEVFQEITGKHYLAFISNLVSPAVKDIAEKINPERVNFITASAHIKELEKRNLMQTFIAHCLLLKEKGFNLFISEVAYPYITDKAEKYKEYFHKQGLELEFMAFRGTWNKKKYPDAYTQDEINVFNLNKAEHTRHDIFNRKNRICNAGYNIAVVDNGGNAHPCFSLLQEMGNIYDKIQFTDTLIKCPFKFCGCPFPFFEPYIYRKAIKELGGIQAPNVSIAEKKEWHFLKEMLFARLKRISLYVKNVIHKRA